MQCTIVDGILYVQTRHGMIYIEQVRHASIVSYLHTCGYRPITAQAVAYGALAERGTTIQLAQLVRLLQSS